MVDNHGSVFDFYYKEQEKGRGKLAFPRQQNIGPTLGSTTRNLLCITLVQSEPP